MAKSLSSSTYGRTFTEFLRRYPKAESNRFLAAFVNLIHQNGDWPRRKRILRSCELRWRKTAGRPLLTIESARRLSPAQRQVVDKQFAHAPADLEEVLRPELLAGVRLTQNDERQLDWTLAKLLRETFVEQEVRSRK
ncbi:MAG: hypothetical protein HY978_02280 [Candidatus Liptonbacteria bacterium]|nr:hypothetical protein [Candidatus Liptonbacteria bacterium]